MTELNHLKLRDLDRVKRNTSASPECEIHILTASQDLGVVRNGGRRGSNFGPQAILSNVLKMASHQKKNTFYIHEVASAVFDQEKEAEAILPSILSCKKIIHIGGGHDHIYPLLKAINKQYKKITVINLDAHLDTRIDTIFHSGTPFRQFAEEAEGSFHLVQFGIHELANPDSSYIELPNGKMDILTFNMIKAETKNFSMPASPLLEKFLEYRYGADHALVFSLDCDVIDSAVMEGVSAVNHQGLPLFLIQEVLDCLLAKAERKFLGMYEYNPVYDNLSEKGSRAIAKLIYGVIE